MRWSRFSFLVTPRRALITLVGLAAVGLLVAWSGVINVGASSGHWRITYWALHWVMQNSTRTYALLEPEPPANLDTPAHVRRAAGHFETSCAFCHGSPLRVNPVLPVHMTPMPPPLSNASATWSRRELSRIVKHGVKYTGMPAWIAPERDDEVWAMVAFLRALPGLSAADYGRLAFGPAVPQDRALEGCARCHGLDGGSGGGAFPVIGGQSEAYLDATLRAFAKGARHSGYMQFAVDGLTDADVRRLAAHYAAQPGVSDTVRPAEGPGAAIALRGLPEADVPACESCHGAPSKRRPDRRNRAYPRLAGQDAAYIAGQLRLFRKGARGGTDYAHIMQRIAERLPPEAIAAVATFYSGADGNPPK
ncbi:cytochrome c, class I [Ancylobacter novellus DSM 506]|uniref:Cytochrome c, class I n=1 Tax=Ancylobacter novellus (strain ATCC 8093 / DSM 506 / JCM 20403 / CCM 1077 / IAM 12100 / NBRC 12443 / NCIMB 10456) TaxID=639283 RepID=D7A6W5_ANCN5|nr:c-type cytochrome [Ancylobacter novellus]ADH88339.1 cytochrome c, class I [Ancylobacter novellus DSM 506]